jgi:hypothetical protein
MSLRRSVIVAGTVLALGAAAPAPAVLTSNALTSNALNFNALVANALNSNALTTDPRLANRPMIADLNGVAVEGVTLLEQIRP